MTYRFSMRICGSLLPMAMLVGSAWGQGGDQANVTNPVPSSQALTFPDLEGAKIHAKLVTDMLAQRQGRQGPVTQEADWQINVQPEQMISFSFRATSRTLRGTRTSPVRAATVKLDEPWSTPDGKAVWQFKDGDLNFVRSYQGGAVRTIFSLKRDGQKLVCATTTIFARERGKNGLVLNSAIDGAPVTILSWKPVSSTCDITGKGLDTADPSKP